MRLIARRLIQLVVVVILATFIVFALQKARGGDPATAVIPFGSAQQRAQFNKDQHLSDPYFVQYGKWLGNFLQGDMGKTYNTNQDVSDLVKDAAPVSIQLILYAQVLALLIAIPAGVFTAYRAGTKTDTAINAIAFGLLSIPAIVLALVLSYYLSAKWKIFTTPYVPLGAGLSEHIQGMVLPVVTLAVGQIAVYMRLLRSDMIATLQENFITMAKSKGISNQRVLWRHALRPSSLTLLTVAGLNFGTLISGAIIVEVLFSLPGIGQLLANAIVQVQYPMLQSIVALIAIVYVVVNFLLDALYVVIDPRIRHARSAA
jgi:peptide/nickel transport system permease protein